MRDAIDQAGSDLNASRIRTRAPMGNCQGGFCCHRMASELHPTYAEPVVRDSWDDLLQERWKGQRHAPGENSSRRRCSTTRSRRRHRTVTATP